MSTAAAPARLVAWSLVCVAVVLAALQTWLFFGWSVIRADAGGWPVLTLGLTLWAVLGAVIVGRHPRHRVAWLFIAGGLLASLGICLSGYSEVTSSGPLFSWAVWLGLLLDAPQPLFFLSLLFLLFPTGHLPSRRWRPVAWGTWASFIGLMLMLALAVPPWSITPARRDDLYEGGWSAYPLASLMLLALLVALFAAAASVVVRMRHARGVERQQLRWLAVASSMVAVTFLLAAALPWHTGFLGWVRILPLQLSIVAVVVGAALAILRYRLWDLDVVVSRAILLTTSTLVVAAGYTLLVVLVGSLLPGRVRDAFWPSLLATAAVALAFQPLRSRIVRFADRLAFGSRAVPYEALADFGRSLEQAPGAVDLLRNVAHAVVDAAGARRATAVLELPDGSAVAQAWPAPDGDRQGPAVTVFPVTDRGERLGRVELEMPPGRPLRPDEAGLVDRLLAQSALAVRNLRLETELAAQVTELGRQTAALEESRRRLVLAGDEEKARFAAALRQTVLPHLDPLPDRLLGVAAETIATGGHGVDLAAERSAATAALDELRRLVRGARPAGRQPAAEEAADHEASSRSGPNADLVT